MSKIQKHSQKPDIVKDRIVELCGDVPRIELFARQRTKGWDVWGNEVSEEVTYSDPVSQKLDEVEAQLIEQLAKPVHKIIKGRKGATVIDVTAESIAQLQDIRNNRKKWRTQFNIR